MITLEIPELKPCPFCGFKAVLESEPAQTGCCAAKWRAACSRGCVHSRWIDAEVSLGPGIGHVNIELSVQRHLTYFWNDRKP